MHLEITSQLSNQTIAELVTADYRTAGVFRKYGLDFCCGGKKTVSDACSSHNLDAGEVLGELGRVMAS
ncbi:MAG: DUF542 domain-containing protein, partial [Cyclonatronaceae bacterium]